MLRHLVRTVNGIVPGSVVWGHNVVFRQWVCFSKRHHTQTDYSKSTCPNQRKFSKEQTIYKLIYNLVYDVMQVVRKKFSRQNVVKFLFCKKKVLALFCS